jgi:hypothetical protein
MKESDFKNHKISNKDANTNLKQKKIIRITNIGDSQGGNKEFSNEIKIPIRKRRSDDKIDPNVVFFIILVVIFLISYLYFSNFYFV